MTRLIYLATPYSHPDSQIRQKRFEQAVHIAAELMREGIYLFSPIAHTHSIATAGNLPCGWDYWNEYDRLMLSVCTELWVIKMEGWEQSQGIKGEIEIAKELNKEIRYINLEELYLELPNQ